MYIWNKLSLCKIDKKKQTRQMPTPAYPFAHQLLWTVIVLLKNNYAHKICNCMIYSQQTKHKFLDRTLYYTDSCILWKLENLLLLPNKFSKTQHFAFQMIGHIFALNSIFLYWILLSHFLVLSLHISRHPPPLNANNGKYELTI